MAYRQHDKCRISILYLEWRKEREAEVRSARYGELKRVSRAAFRSAFCSNSGCTGLLMYSSIQAAKQVLRSSDMALTVMAMM